MSFEDIIKRFSFDLEMGRFIEFEDNEIIFFINNENVFNLFIDILIKLGFREWTIVELNKTNIIGIIISNKTKKWIYITNDDYIDSYTKNNSNVIPDYIKEFIIEQYGY